MKTIIISLVVGVVALIAIASQEAPAEAGNCWGLKPLCPPGQSPVCICQNYQCMWICSQ